MSDVSSWAAEFRDPGPRHYPQPTLVIGRELGRERVGADLDRLRASGYCTVVVVPLLGPPYAPEPYDVRRAFGNFWSQIGTILDLAAERGMRVWFETFQKSDIEDAARNGHPEFQGQVLAEVVRGAQYVVRSVGFDRLNPAATDALIREYFGEFERRFPNTFGSTLIGFWDDESTFNTAAQANVTLPWSRVLSDAFERKKGYRIDLDTPALLQYLFHGDTPRARQVRTDYLDVISELFGRDHFGRMSRWLEARGLRLVVQPLGDGSQLASDQLYEGSFFDQVAASSVPGADMLRNDDDQGGIGSDYYGMVLKQTSSAAHLYGSSDAQHEPFGHGQWSLMQMRYYTDRMFARGITLVHPVFYMERGGSPANVNEVALNDLFTGNVQWPFQHIWARYAARLHALVDGGVTQASVLLLYPINAAWARDPDSSADMRPQNAYLNLGTALIDAHRGFDAGPEDVIVDSATTVTGGHLIRGGRRYETVVLPSTDTIGTATARRLEALVKSGGDVIAVDRIPTRSPDGRDAAVAASMQRIFGVDPAKPVPRGVAAHRHPSGGSGIVVGASIDQTTDYGDETPRRYAVFWDALALTGGPDAALSPERLNHTSTLTSELGAVVTGQDHTANEVLHLRKLGTDVYFVTNYPDGHERFLTDANAAPLAETPLDTVLAVPVPSGVPQIWDPQTGTIADAPAWWRTEDGLTHVELHLPPQGGLAVVFRNGLEPCHITRAGTGVTAIRRKGSNVSVTAAWDARPRTEAVPVTCANGSARPELRNEITLDPIRVSGPWKFDFQRFRPPGSLFNPVQATVRMGLRGAGSWTRPEGPTDAPPIIGLSGTGTYATFVTASGTLGGLFVPPSHLQPKVRLLLDLGTVRDVSTLWVNDRLAGTRAWPAHAYDVTELIERGLNRVRMAITNGSANGAVGFQASPVRDSGLLTEPILRPIVRVSATGLISGTAG